MPLHFAKGHKETRVFTSARPLIEVLGKPLLIDETEKYPRQYVSTYPDKCAGGSFDPLRTLRDTDTAYP